MGLRPVAELRAEAERLGPDGFADLVGGPALVYRERLQGDLHFVDPGVTATAPMQRPGNTLIHIPRVTARDRLTGPAKEGRRPVPEQVYLLRGPTTVGRHRTNDVVLRDHSVSGRHARLHPVPETDWVFLVDQGSRNGTAHNGRALAKGERAELMTGDEVCFGREVVVFLHRNDLYKYLTGTL